MPLSLQMHVLLLNKYLKIKLLIYNVFVFLVVLADANLFVTVLCVNLHSQWHMKIKVAPCLYHLTLLTFNFSHSGRSLNAILYFPND